MTMMRDFSRLVVAPPPRHGVSRWNTSICIGVINLANAPARYMVDRISEIASGIGVSALVEGCSPNILIIWTDDGDAMANAMAQRNPLAFRPRYSGSSHGRAALQRFRDGDQPVRWWHVSLPVNSETGAPAVRMPGEETPPAVRGEGRLRTPVRYDFQRAFVIIDVTLTGNATLQQITDYVAMAALAQIDPQADLSRYPTILNLFNGSAVDQRMSEWDEDWLQALYHAELNQSRGANQVTSIGSAMYHDRQRSRNDNRPSTDPATD